MTVSIWSDLVLQMFGCFVELPAHGHGLGAPRCVVHKENNFFPAQQLNNRIELSIRKIKHWWTRREEHFRWSWRNSDWLWLETENKNTSKRIKVKKERYKKRQYYIQFFYKIIFQVWNTQIKTTEPRREMFYLMMHSTHFVNKMCWVPLLNKTFQHILFMVIWHQDCGKGQLR